MRQNNYNKHVSKANTPIYSDGKVVGTVSGTTFKKSIEGSRHILRKPRSIAISVDALIQAEQEGAICIEIYDRETKTIYTASFEHFKTHNWIINRGYGEQAAMLIGNWTVVTPNEPITSQASTVSNVTKPVGPKPIQPSFFEAA